MKKHIRIDVDDSAGTPVTIHDASSTVGYTADVTGGMTYSASSYNGTDTPSKAFDNNNTTYWQTSSSSLPQWIECDFGIGNKKQIGKITIRTSVNSGRGPNEFELKASNDGTNWDTLLTDNVPNVVSTTTTFIITYNKDYRYYRVYIISAYNNWPYMIAEIEMMEELYTKYCISVEYPHNFGENLSTINCKFRTSDNDDELTEGRLIQIWSKVTTPVGNANADRVFKGYIDSSRMEGKIISVTAKDFLVKAQWKRGTENEDYDDQTSIKTIFSDLCTLAGLTASNSSTATSPVNMEQFYCNNTNVFERMTQLANTTGWYFYYDPTTTQTVYFQPKSELTLQEYYFGGANNNMLSLPNWNFDARDLINDIDVVGGNNKINQTWSTTPDGSNWYQVEDETLEDVTVYGTGTTVSAVPKTSWSFPNEYSITGNGYVIFNLDMIPDSGVGTLKVDYSYSQTGTDSNAANSTSKTNFQTREGVSHKRDMVNSTDLAAYASNIVSDTFWGKPVSDVTFSANTKLITPIVGSMVNVTDVVSGKSITYASDNSIIISQIDSWPATGSEVRISTKPIKKPDLITTVQDTVSKLSNEFNKLDWKNYMKMDGSTSFQDNIDMGKKQLLNMVFHKVADDTARGNINAVEGMVVYQQDTDTAYIYDGAAWDELGSGAGVSEDQSLQNLLANGDFESWSAGTSSAPDFYLTSGAGATVAKETTIIKQGLASVKLTCAVTTDTSIRPANTVYTKIIDNRTVTLGAWVYATLASRAKLVLHDGTTTTSSDFHTGGSSWEWLTVTATIKASPTVMYIYPLFIASGAVTSAYADGAMLVEGSSCPAFSPKPLYDDGQSVQINPATNMVTLDTLTMEGNIVMADKNITGANIIQATTSQSLTLKVSSGQSIIFQAV